MQTELAQSTSNGTYETAPTANQNIPTLYTVEQFATMQPAFTPAALRNLIFKAEARYSSKGKIPGNGLLECGAVIRIGRKVLISAPHFLSWVSSQQPRGARC